MVNFVVLGIILGFFYFLFIMCSIIVSLHITKKPSEEELIKNKVGNRLGLVIIPVSFGIFIVIFSVNLLTGASIKQGDDIANWITLTVEVGVGITIALVILIYSQFQGKRSISGLSKQLQETQDTILEIKTSGSPFQFGGSIQTDTSTQEDIPSQKNYSYNESLQE